MKEDHRSFLSFIQDRFAIILICHRSQDKYSGVLGMGAIAAKILNLDPKFSKS
jgi:hypothetical protein